MKKYQITNIHDIVNTKSICVNEFGDPDINAPQFRETAMFDSISEASDFFTENNLREFDWIIESVECNNR